MGKCIIYKYFSGLPSSLAVIQYLSVHNLSKWGYADTADTACECGTSEQTMQHLLRCPLLENECSLEDRATANEKALHCARAWPNIMTKFGDDGHERRSAQLFKNESRYC